MKLLLRIMLIPASLALLACGAQEEPWESFVADSAGVRIVQHGLDAEPAAVLRVAPEPDFRVGWDPAGPTFAWVDNGLLLEDGRAVVADKIHRTLTVLSPRGEILEVFGGPGQGPGEIRRITNLCRLPGDTLVLQDPVNGRFSLFHEGTFVRSIPYGPLGSTLIGMAAIGGYDGGLILRRAAHDPNFPEPWLQGVIVRFDLESQRMDTIRTFDWVLNKAARRGTFFPGGAVGYTAGSILVGRQDQPWIERLSLEGRVTEIVRFPREPEVITDSSWAVYEWLFMTDPALTHDTETRAIMFAQKRPEIGSPLPHYFRLLGDDAGNAWVGAYSLDYRTTEHFDVFSPTGAWLASVSLPPRVQVLDIRQGRILATQYDDLGGNAVTVFRIDGWHGSQEEDGQ